MNCNEGSATPAEQYTPPASGTWTAGDGLQLASNHASGPGIPSYTFQPASASFLGWAGSSAASPEIDHSADSIHHPSQRPQESAASGFLVAPPNVCMPVEPVAFYSERPRDPGVSEPCIAPRNVDNFAQQAVFPFQQPRDSGVSESYIAPGNVHNSNQQAIFPFEQPRDPGLSEPYMAARRSPISAEGTTLLSEETRHFGHTESWPATHLFDNPIEKCYFRSKYFADPGIERSFWVSTDREAFLRVKHLRLYGEQGSGMTIKVERPMDFVRSTQPSQRPAKEAYFPSESGELPASFRRSAGPSRSSRSAEETSLPVEQIIDLTESPQIPAVEACPPS